ncbi:MULTISPECIES: hypothetical protein [Helicobacter]|uniref:hypothetical protein n=1 Tax=Helicobacter TaxID=209 RepID=UPI000EAF34C2|nr:MULTISPECIES: hypothetical protein [Helicobacter]
MDLLIQNIKQDDLGSFQELAARLGVSLEVLPAHTPHDHDHVEVLDAHAPDHLEIFANTPADGDCASLENAGEEPGSYRRSSRVCNSYYNPLNTHQRDHRAHDECERERTHRYKKDHSNPSEPFF